MRPSLEGHLADMRLRGLSESTVYARGCAVRRLAAWLECQVFPCASPGQRVNGVTVEGLSGFAYATTADVVPAPGDLGPSVRDASAADLLAWRTSLTVSPKSVGPYVDHVRGWYGWLVRTGYRPDNPALNLPVPRGHRGLPRPISEAALFAALDRAPRRVRPWLVLASGAGFRAKEIALLRRENVVDAASQPYLLVAEDATKGRRERVVPMSTWVLAELRAAGLPGRGLVFRRHDGGTGSNKPWLVSKLSNDCLHRSGTAATLHALRHRFLTLAYQESLDLRLVQELAGHSSPAVTAVYTLVSPSRAAAVVEAIPAPGRLRAVGE